MYGFLNRSGGFARLRIIGTQKEKFLNLCAMEGAEPSKVKYIDSVTVELTVPSRQRMKAERIAERSRCSVELLRVMGGANAWQMLRKRAGAFLLIFLAVFLVFASTAFIWEIDISGNEKVSDAQIVAALRRSGVEVGRCWLGLTSDNVRSEVVYRLPELAWITVNIYGSRAEVIVRERVEKPEMHNDKTPSDIVAAKSGFVTGVMALTGSSEVVKGSAVLEGERLISGVVESPFGGMRTVHAFGSVRALTYNELTGVMPNMVRCKNYTGTEKHLWSVLAFGKRINFYGKGSISYADCDKINDVWALGIDGLFSLPVSITRQTLRFYEIVEKEADAALSEREIGQSLRDYLIGDMSEGEILTENYTASKTNGCLCVCLRASCSEEIGRSVVMDEARLFEAVVQNDILQAQKENE